MIKGTLLAGSAAAVMGMALAAAPAAAQTADGANEQEGGFRTIIVTAQRREDSIQSVPLAVSALDAEALQDASIDDIRDIAGRVPGLVVDPVNAGPSAAAISIRGISFEDIEKSFDPAVGVVVDGVFIGTNTGQLLDAFNLESIEVLRGPQGTLFGRNTIAGVINVQRRRPTGEFGVEGSLGWAEFDTWRGRFAVDTPRIGDVLSLRAFFLYDDTGGYLNNVTQNETQGAYEVWTAGVSALIEPAEGIEALITVDHTEEDGETAVASVSSDSDLICLQVPVPGVGLVRAFGIADQECNRFNLGGDGFYTIFQNIDTPVTNETDSISGQITIDIGNFELVSVTGWRRNEESVRQDFDASSIDFFDTLRNQEYEQFSQELRIQGDVTPWLNALIGGYYFESDYTLAQTTNLGFVPAVLTQRTRGESESYAIFGDVRISPVDDVTINLGGRYTEDQKSLTTNFGFTTDGSCPTFIPVISLADCSGSDTFDEFTWRASIDYQIDPDRLVYLSYSTGFRSGGFNGRAATPSSLGPYQPETVDAYEFGFKADWLDRRLRTNIAIYHTEYNNKQEEVVRATPPQFAALNPQETIVENAASARISGFEAEIIALPSDDLAFRGSLSIIDAEYDSFFRDVNGDLVPDDVSTLDLRRAPPISWSVGMDYNRPIGDSGEIDFSTTFRYIDEYTTCIVAAQPAVLGAVTNDPRCESDDRTIWDASLSYTLNLAGGGEVRFTVFGRNLLDDRGLSSTLPVAGLFAFSGTRPPQQFGAEVGFRF
ncbi:MAG: TonB-dependent receptor [Parasphingopyxis sp.]|uniref:TonB-dependent receptor n=1 Tax=Parasphingopyxis sp. TaxID=1920299 RepID=UPI003FA0A31A